MNQATPTIGGGKPQPLTPTIPPSTNDADHLERPVSLHQLHRVAKEYADLAQRIEAHRQLCRRFFERFEVKKKITAPRFRANGKVYPQENFDNEADLKSLCEMVLGDLALVGRGKSATSSYEDDEAGMQVDPTPEFLSAKYDALSAALSELDNQRTERLRFIHGPDVSLDILDSPDSSDNPEDLIDAAIDEEQPLGRAIGQILGSPAQTPTCAYIKARLLELFAICGERREDRRFPELVSDEAVQLGAARISDALRADTPHAGEVDELIATIRDSIVAPEGVQF